MLRREDCRRPEGPGGGNVSRVGDRHGGRGVAVARLERRRQVTAFVILRFGTRVSPGSRGPVRRAARSRFRQRQIASLLRRRGGGARCGDGAAADRYGSVDRGRAAGRGPVSLCVGFQCRPAAAPGLERRCPRGSARGAWPGSGWPGNRSDGCA